MMEPPKNNRYQNIPYLGCTSDFLEEIADNIDQFELFRRFSPQELLMLSRHLHCYAAPRGYLLFEKGELSDHLIVILSGEVSVKENNRSKARVLGAGVTIGSETFVDQHQWGASCTVNKPTDLAVLSKDGLNAILMHSPRLGNRFLLAIMQSIVVKIRAIEQDADHKAELLLS